MKPSAPKQNAHHHPKAMEGAAIDKPYFASTTSQVNRLALACTTGASYGKISTKAKAPARKNVLGIAVATPTDKRGFVMSEFSGHGVGRTRMVYGHGVGYPQGCPHGYSHVLNRHAHPLRVRTQCVASKSRIGATTMHQVNPMGHLAPMPKAAPAIPSTTEAQAHALLEATTSASLAGFYLRKGSIAQAKRKAVQLLKALHTLQASHEGKE